MIGGVGADAAPGTPVTVAAAQRFARSLTLNDADAEDLVQDTLVKVIVHWERVVRADNVDGYVRRTMVNTFLSARRLASARTVVSDDTVERALPAG